MGKPTGFIEYLGETAGDRPAAGRIADWKEFSPALAGGRPAQNRARAAWTAALPLPQPACYLSGMASGCPIHNLIPEWNDLIYRGL